MDFSKLDPEAARNYTPEEVIGFANRPDQPIVVVKPHHVYHLTMAARAMGSSSPQDCLEWVLNCWIMAVKAENVDDFTP